MQSNVVQLRQESVFSLTPTTLNEAMELAKLMADSEFVPQAYRGKPGNVLVAVQMGSEIGLSPMAALQSIAVINGKPGIYGDAGKALLLQAGCLIDEDDTEKIRATGKARCKVTRPNGQSTERTFSLDDAKDADLLGKSGPWKQYRYRQMAWRAFWFAARDGAADILKGMKGAEELMDLPTERDMGAADVVDAKPDIAARVRQATGHESKATTKPAADKPPTLAAVLEQIAASSTPEEMKQAGEMSTKLVDGEDRDKARVAYRARMAALKKAAADAAEAAAAAEAGATQQQGGPTYAEVADMISKADSVAAVNAALDLARSFKDDGQREELIELGAKKADELTPV